MYRTTSSMRPWPKTTSHTSPSQTSARSSQPASDYSQLLCPLLFVAIRMIFKAATMARRTPPVTFTAAGVNMLATLEAAPTVTDRLSMLLSPSWLEFGNGSLFAEQIIRISRVDFHFYNFLQLILLAAKALRLFLSMSTLF